MNKAALDVIFKRASIRKFSDEEVSEEDIKTILDAGFSAPSARNMRPYHFIVIKDNKIKEEISKLSIGKGLLKDAKVVFAIVGDLSINPAYEFVMNDTSACIENMLLAVTALDLGACWCGQRRDETDVLTRKILNLSKDMFVSGFIGVGHKAQEKVQVDRYDETKVHLNHF